MPHHIEICVSDLAATKSFWRNLLKRVGDRQTGSWAMASPCRTARTAISPSCRSPPAMPRVAATWHRSGVGLNHLAFRVENRAAVDGLRVWCRKKKIPMLSNERHPFATGGTDYDALFVEDPDRIKVEFVAG